MSNVHRGSLWFYLGLSSTPRMMSPIWEDICSQFASGLNRLPARWFDYMLGPLWNSYLEDAVFFFPHDIHWSLIMSREICSMSWEIWYPNQCFLNSISPKKNVIQWYYPRNPIFHTASPLRIEGLERRHGVSGGHSHYHLRNPMNNCFIKFF